MAAKKQATEAAALAAGRPATAKKAATDKATVTKKAPARHTARKSATKRAHRSAAEAAEDLVVRDDESPWTADELAEVRGELAAVIDKRTAELSEMEADLAGLIRDSGDGAGDDQADAGTKNFATDYEYAVAEKARQSLLQSVHAMERIDDGTYGVCESCGKPIGKLRLQAFPRATLCLQCKQAQERR